MNMLNQEEAKRICDKILALSKSDECRITINGARTGNIRFALNNISTSGLVDDCQLSVAVAFGKRQGTATINELDDKSLERVVRRAEELARLAPENPQFEAAVGKQNFLASPTFIQRTADIDPEFRAEIAARSIEACRKKKMIAAGYFTDNASFEVIANSNGVFGYQTFTTSEYSCTTRTEDERGSGWVSRGVNDVRKFDVREAVGVAIEKGLRSVDAKALEPGRYTVILEPAASAGLMGPMFNAFDARQADEGRSFLSKKGGGNRLGDKLYDEQLNIWADPWDSNVPVLPWDASSMLARERRNLIEGGKIASLDYSPYWAAKQGVQARGRHGNLVMAGGSQSTAELIASTKKGVLVTRTWYIRMVDPQSLLLTGLTRDGTFYIENGKIKYPIKNFRFNESPVSMLNNIDALGKSDGFSEGGGRFRISVPSMRLRDFNFSSLSDAV